MSPPLTTILDHIVHLTPPGTVAETSQKFKELGFNVVPGGTHAGGLTANVLVIFQDNIYLELISFIHPPSHYPPGSPERRERESHYWASKSPGWIDFAFLGDSETSISKIINERSEREGSRVCYLPEQKGGRERPDGRVIEWVISAAAKGHGRGVVPFFCGDVSPRKCRVPIEPPSNTQHLSTARGIAHIRILVDECAFIVISKQLTSVIGSQPTAVMPTEAIWVLDTPITATGGQDEHEKPQLILSVPKDDSEHEVLKRRGPGMYEVAFWVDESQESRSVSTPYGKIVLSPAKKTICVH